MSVGWKARFDPHWNRVRAVPTEPPSRRLHFIGGLVYCDPSAYGDGRCSAWQFDSAVVEVDRLVGAAGAGVYRGYCLVLSLPPFEAHTPGFVLVGPGLDCADAAEAEAMVESVLQVRGHSPQYYGYPLAGLVLRWDSDGLLPIDWTNRGRSYLWPQDVRPLEYTLY